VRVDSDEALEVLASDPQLTEQVLAPAARARTA
jgi:hypothetical protein